MQLKSQPFGKQLSRSLRLEAINVYTLSTGLLIGAATGCLIMWIAHKDSIQHYNICQESQLLDSISPRLGDEKSWYIKEDSFGKIKLVQLSNNKIDSLNSK